MNDDGTTKPHEPDVPIYDFADDGSIPNNPILPLLPMRTCSTLLAPMSARHAMSPRHASSALPPMAGIAPGETRSFRFHTTTRTAHEVLGICQSEAKVRLGGEHGLMMRIKSGDALVLPAGTGHQNLGSSLDLRRRWHLSGRHGLRSLSWQTACSGGGTPQHPSRTASG